LELGLTPAINRSLLTDFEGFISEFSLSGADVSAKKPVLAKGPSLPSLKGKVEGNRGGGRFKTRAGVGRAKMRKHYQIT